MNYLHKELYDLIKADTTIFDFIQTSSLDGLWYWDLENPTEEWINPRFWTTLGYDPKEMPHKAAAWKDIVHAEDFELAVKAVQKHIADPSHVFDIEIRYTHKNGSIIWTNCKGLAIRDAAGKAIRMLGTHKNITQLKRSQNLLQEANRAAKVGIWEIDLEHQHLYWSDITKEIHEVPLDFEPNLETGINFYKEGESRDMITACVNKAMSDGTPWDVELQLVTAKQKEIWVRAIGQTEFNDGKCIRVYGVFQDIDTRKKAAEKLRATEQQFQQIFEHAVIGMALVGTDAKWIQVNQSLCDLLGYSRAEMTDQNFRTLSHPDDLLDSEKELLELFQGKRPAYLKEKRYIHKNGSILWLIIGVSVVADEQGKPLHFVAQYLDITERKAAEERNKRLSILEAKSKEMEQFAYIASHDLREPLTTMKGYLALLKEEFSAQMPEDAQDILQFTIERANRMDELIHGLLDYSRLSQVKAIETVDCNKILVDVLADLSLTIHKNAVQIEYSSLPILNAHPLELKLLFQNLISNAIKFRKPDLAPIISIHCEPIAKGWQFQIKDNGIGIESSQKKRIFYIFQRLHKEEYEGTGIGLANCKKIVELHNGEIWVNSTIGEGSTFCFTIKTEKKEI